jgi:hypothetical protein
MLELMDKNELVKILDDWNFWNKKLDTGIARKIYLDKLKKALPSEQVKVIIGARRSGKSYIMRQFAWHLIEKENVNKDNILMVNFEDPRFAELDTKLLDRLFEAYLEHRSPRGKIYLFLDEIQEVPRWEKWVRAAQELKKADMIISGSNAKLLSGELATVLTGRHLDITVMPLSLREFLDFKGLGAGNAAEIIKNEIRINSLLEEFMRFGSFPLVVLGQEREKILLSYFDDVVNRDLVRRYKIRKTEEIKKLIKFYMSNISSPVTFTSSGKFLGISAQSAERFSAYLEASYLTFFVKRFSFKFKEQEKSPRKVYAIDTGLANIAGFQFSPNRGKLAENAVFLELKRKAHSDPRMEIYYWKSLAGEEVDFVIKEDASINQLIQVCWDARDAQTKNRETKSLVKAMAEFESDNGIIITGNYKNEEIVNGKKIKYIPLGEWLLASC